jgi:hypothetical protein
MYICAYKEKIAGANPTIVRYNASAEKIYSPTSSLVRFENKIFSSALKNALAYYIQRWRCSCKFRSRRTGSRMNWH